MNEIALRLASRIFDQKLIGHGEKLGAIERLQRFVGWLRLNTPKRPSPGGEQT